MTRFSARNLASGDNSKHGSGIFVGKITATSDDEKHALVSDRGVIDSRDRYALVRTNTVRVKIDDQCDIPATFSDSMMKEDSAHQQNRNPPTTHT